MSSQREEKKISEASSISWLRRSISWLIPSWRQRNRPTMAGWLLILISMGIGIAAYNTASNILFLVLSFVFALLIVNGILSVSNFRKLKWELRVPDGCRAREKITLEIAIHNQKRYQSTYAIWFNLYLPDKPAQRLYLKERLGPGEKTVVSAYVLLQERGQQTLRVDGPESMFPFGFLRKQTGHHVSSELLVWPSYRKPGNATPHPRDARQLGQFNQRLGYRTDLVMLREYQHGDPLRMIHWKATARTGRLMIRNMADEGVGSFALRLDTSSLLWTSEAHFENFLSVVSTVAEELFTEGRLLGYFIDDQPLVQIKGIGDLYLLNDKLAVIELSDHHPKTINSRYNLLHFVPAAEDGVQVRSKDLHEDTAA